MYNFNYKLIWLIKQLILIIAASFSIWLTQITTLPNQESPKIVKRHERDLFAVNFMAVIMDQMGKPHYRIQSNYIEHFPDDDSTNLKNPNFILFNQGAPAWILSAMTGTVTTQGEMVRLSEQVKIQQSPEATGLELNTFEIRLYPKRQFGETEYPVVIKRPQQLINAVGMEIDLKQKQLILLHEVRGSFNALNYYKN